MGDAAGALRFYREYLRQSPEAADRETVQGRISDIERALQEKGVQQLTVLSDPDGATVFIDEKPVGVTPWTGELYPGRHRVRVRREGYADADQQIELLAHRALDVSVSLEAEQGPAPQAAAPVPAAVAAPRPPPPQDQPPADEGGVQPWTWATLGVGVGALGAALVFEGLRRSSESAVSEEDTQLARHEAYDQMQSRQTTARVLAGVGAGLTVVGGVLLFLDLSSSEASPQSATVGCSPLGCGVAVKGAF